MTPWEWLGSAFDGFERLVAQAPGGQKVFRNAVASTTEKVRQGVDKLVSDLTKGKGVGPESAGRAARQGITDFTARFRLRSQKLWQDVDELIPRGTRAGVANTENTLRQMTTAIDDAPALSETLGNNELGRIANSFLSDVGPDAALPYQALSSLRTKIGERIANPSLISDVSTKQYRRLYGALSEDMRNAAKSAGPQALQKFQRANAFERSGSKRIENAFDGLAKKDADSAISNALFSGSKRGPEQLRTLLKSVTPDQEGIIVADVLNRIGTANPSQQGAEAVEFSFGTFMSNWAKLREAGTLDVLFKRGNNVQLGQALDKLSRAATRVRETSQVFANPPGTASALVGQTALALGAGGVLLGNFTLPLTLAGTGGIANMSARLMTSPRFVKWLAQTSTLKPNGIAAHISRLSGIAPKESPDVQAAIGGYLEALQLPQAEATEASPVGAPPSQKPPVARPAPIMGELRGSVQEFAQR